MSKAFEEYWSRAHRDIGQIAPWQSARLKNIAWLAWKAGRRVT